MTHPPADVHDAPVWDIMLSYRRKNYSSDVSCLADSAVEAGLRCWLDVWNIDQEIELSPDELRSCLRDAAAKSRIVVGFTDSDALALDPGTRTPEILFNWRLYEHQFAREFVWVDGSYLCSFPDNRIPFFNIHHLAYYLALACDKRAQLEHFWNVHLAQFRSIVKYGVYLVAKYHEMPVDFLPSIIHPALRQVRPNSMSKTIQTRREIDSDHNMDLFNDG